MKKQGLLIVFFLLLSPCLMAQTVISGIVNGYAKVTSIDITNNVVTVDNATGFQRCGIILLMQMKGASISIANDSTFGRVLDYKSAGLYERAIIDMVDIGGNKLYLRHKLLNTYDVAGIVQVVSVPQYTDVDILGTLQGKPFDGQTGGIIAIEATGTVTLKGQIDAAGIGFRGGKVNTNTACTTNSATDFFYSTSLNNAGLKGESIVLTTDATAAGKGRSANGGGGGACTNGGGGGGAGSGNGGLGGRSPAHLTNSATVSGVGANALLYNSQLRLFLGGGGGAGHQDNSAASDGGNGGGIIYITASQLVGGGTINVNGFDANNAGTDGAGGGGGGGTIALNIANNPVLVALTAKGGNGGNNTATVTANDQCFATGGGGGGGTVLARSGNININTTVTLQGGLAGKIQSTSQCTGTSHGATNGITGQTFFINNWVVPQGTQEQPILSTNITTTAANCTDNQQVLAVDATVGALYQWQRNGQDIPAATSPSFTATESGIYRVKVNYGCRVASSTDYLVTVKSTPVAYITGNNVQKVCPSSGTYLQTLLFTGYTYQWRLNGINIVGATANFYQATQIGDYDVIVNGCGGTAISNKINLISADITTVPTLKGTAIICANGSTRLQVNNHVAGSAYLWRFNGTIIPNASNFFYEASRVGNYSVANLNSCNTTFSEPFFVGLGEGISQATITGSSRICPSKSIVLRATQSIGASYVWFRNDTLITGATTDALVITRPARYHVQITDICQKVVVSAPFVVQLATISTPIIRGQNILCKGEAPLSTPRTLAYQYQWFKDGTALNNATDTLLIANAAGRYTVQATDSCGQTSTSAIFFVRIDDLTTTTISISAPRTVLCNNTESIVLTAETSSLGATIQWKRNGVNIPNANTTTYTATQTGFYTVELRNSCSTLTSNTLEIRQGILPVAVISGQPVVCAGFNTTLQATTGTNFKYQWFKDGKAVEAANDAKFATFTAGSYTVMITNADGCSVISAPFTLTVSNITNSNVSPDKVICLGERTSLFAQAQGAVKYVWTPAEGLSSTTVASPTAAPTQTTVYTVRIENQFGCFIERKVKIEVLPTITADFDIQILPQCGDKTKIKLVSNVSNIEDFADLIWSMGNGDTLKGKTPPIYTYPQSGQYTVTLTVRNRVCNKVVTKSLSVENLNLTNVVTPNGDGKNDKLEIDMPNQGWKLEIYNRFGQRIYQSDNYDNSWGDAILSGTYFYKLVSSEKRECVGWIQVLSLW